MNEVAAEFAYDEVAYPSAVVGTQTPSHLLAAGLLHGWRAAPPASARVLEIGCGDGLNLMGIAAVAPRSTCVGFDLSRAAIARGRTILETSGLRNVDLHQGDILTYPRGGEPFDYILAHGVYTWLPEPVRPALLDLIGKRLAPGGVAYVSFDALPAAAPKAAINAFLMRELQGVKGIEARCTGAARLLAMLARNQRSQSRLTVQLDSLVRDLPGLAPGYFYHDWLAEHYAPTSLDDFSAEAAKYTLKRAGDATMHDIFVGDLDPEARVLVEASGDDIERRSNLLQMLRGAHQFRSEMLVRADAPPPRVEWSEAVKSLSFHFGGSRLELEQEDGPAVRYLDGERQYLTTSDPVQQAVLNALMEAAPAERCFAELQQRTGAEPGALARILHYLSGRSLVNAHGTPQNFTLTPGVRPTAGAFVRALAVHGTTLISLRHVKTVADDDLSRTLLTLCDGSRTRDALASMLSQAAGHTISAEMVDGAIAHFANYRLFEA